MNEQEKHIQDQDKQISDLEKLVNKHPVDASEFCHLDACCTLLLSLYFTSANVWTSSLFVPIQSNKACADDDARIMELAQGLPNGCTLAASPSLSNDYRLVCTETGSIQIHLPDMWYVVEWTWFHPAFFRHQICI